MQKGGRDFSTSTDGDLAVVGVKKRTDATLLSALAVWIH